MSTCSMSVSSMAEQRQSARLGQFHDLRPNPRADLGLLGDQFFNMGTDDLFAFTGPLLAAGDIL